MPYASTQNRNAGQKDNATEGAGGGVTVSVPGGVGYNAPAGEPIGSGRIVHISGGRLYVVQQMNPTTPEPVIGVTQEAAPDAGVMVPVVRSGVATGFVGLLPGATYYLGLNGLPTLTPPECGWFIRVGVAQSDTVLFVGFTPPVWRGEGD